MKSISRILKIKWASVIKMSFELGKRSGRNPLSVFLDFIRCYKTRGTSWFDYMLFGFHFNTDPVIRDSFASEYKDNVYMNSKCNSPESLEILMDKGLFNEVYKDFLGREVLDLRKASKEEFLDFINRHNEIIVKPAFESGGSGIEKLTSQEVKEQYNRLVEEGKFVLEEVLVQDPKMGLINDSSVNTIRTCTCINDQGDIKVLYMVLRVGRQDTFLDNMSAGGFYTKLSWEGKITHPCYTSRDFGRAYTHHPDTGMEFVGFQVPQIEEVKDLAISLAKVNPEARYVGWDIAITTKGPVVIEGNERPSVDLPQTYIHLDGKEGMRDEYEEALSIKLPR